MSPAIRVWSDDQDEIEATEIVGHQWPDAAAEDFAENEYERSDHPVVQTINVRCEDGALLQFEVEAEQHVVFSARLLNDGGSTT